VAAVLGVAGIVCCAAGIAGDMMQDLKVGHILGGTPWRMEIGEILGVIAAAMVLALPLSALDKVYHIGSAELPAPQAGLMALMAKGIVGGDMAWPLVIVGMFFAVGLILIKAPSPMLVAVGMYLPFFSTAAIFVGGVIRWVFDKRAERQAEGAEGKARAENVGILLSSGFIAGEALMAVALAFLVLGGDFFPWLTRMKAAVTPSFGPYFGLGLVVYPVILYLLAWLPFKAAKQGGLPSATME
jgi:putative OPT family oligopeptide transporter